MHPSRGRDNGYINIHMSAHEKIPLKVMTAVARQSFEARQVININAFVCMHISNIRATLLQCVD